MIKKPESTPCAVSTPRVPCYIMGEFKSQIQHGGIDAGPLWPLESWNMYFENVEGFASKICMACMYFKVLKETLKQKPQLLEQAS